MPVAFRPSSSDMRLAFNGVVEAVRVLRDEVLVVPALVDHVGEQRVEQRDVGAGLDVQVQHVVLAGDLLGDRHRGRAARVDDDDLGRCRGFAREPLLLLVDRAAAAGWAPSG